MIHHPEYMKELLKKHIERSASAYEESLLALALDLYEEEELDQMIEEISASLQYNDDLPKALKEWRPSAREIISRSRRSDKRPVRSFISSPRSYTTYAATALLAFLLILVLNYTPKLQYSCRTHAGEGNLILAGANTCRLILDNGCSVMIDSNYTGEITRQDNIALVKSQAGILEYKTIAAPGLHQQSIYHTIATSRGAYQRIVLPNGVKITLNAASTIRFPVVFTSDEYAIEVDGEAYFESPQHVNAPWQVVTHSARIEVVKASFNVNTYDNRMASTLSSGELIIFNPYESLRLQPGQQAFADDAGQEGLPGAIKIRSANIRETLSWLGPERIFTHVAMHDFLLEMERRYDLDIMNMERAPHQYFSGTLCNGAPLSELLKLLRANGLHFVQQGNTLIFSRQQQYPSHEQRLASSLMPRSHEPTP